MDFVKYTSIDNCYRQKVIDEIHVRCIDLKDWVVSEKVHGSNFSFWMDNEGCRCARRSGFLRQGDSFFNWERVLDAYSAHLSILYQTCVSILDDLADEGFIEIKDNNLEVVLYGELFGGSYNHPDVEKDPNASRVQKGVSYCPWNDFYAFDLSINGAIISYDIFSTIMENVGFHYAKALYRGAFSECLKFPNDLPTSLPKRLGLPEMDVNISEGVVLKPATPMFFPSGSRVILKNKNEKFAEIEKKTKKPKVVVTLTPEEESILEYAYEYVTENRLRNVLSRFGPVTQKDFGKLLGSFAKDIREDLEKDHGQLSDILEKDRLKIVNKCINSNAQEMIRSNFVNITDNTF